MSARGSSFDGEERTRTAERGAVLVTGIDGRLARRLLRRLHRVRPVIGLGERPARGMPSDVEHFQVDAERSAARQIFARGDVGAIVHLGVVHDPRNQHARSRSRNLLLFQRVIDFAEQYKIPKVVLLSSGNTYGPRPENAQLLTERAPLLAGGRFSEMHALVELDLHAQSVLWRAPELEVVVLRAANVLGTVRNAPSNYLRLPAPPVVLGFDPMVQAVHQDDVVQAIERALEPGVRGIFNVSGPPPVALSRALELLGRRPVPVPHTLLRGGLSGLYRLGITNFPAPELDFIRYVCMVDDGLIRRQLGYTPAHDLVSTLAAVDEERWS